MIKKLFLVTLMLLSVYIAKAQDNAPPTLSNFRIENSNKNRVYFDSSEQITASTTSGFTISGKTISSITINSGAETGHYFTVSSAFTFWDNNTIRYEGGSDLKDASKNDLANFTLEYIINNIPEPSSSGSNYYVAIDGSDSNSGTSENSPFRTIEKALSMSDVGTVYIKAGTYYTSSSINLPSNGTASSPVKIIGYKNTVGDITSMYYKIREGSDAPAVDPNEMPVINGGGGRHFGFSAYNDNYIIIRNVQTINMAYGIRSNDCIGIIIDNCVAKDNEDTGDAWGGSGFLLGIEGRSSYSSSKYRIINSVAVNASMADVAIYGNHNLIDNVKTYCDIENSGYVPATDYYIYITGSNNIIRNSHAERKNSSVGHTGHGIGIKSGENWTFAESYYNLFENNYAKGTYENYYVRNSKADYNVFKDCESDGYGKAAGTSYGANANGMVFMSDVSNNIVEGMNIHDVAYAFAFHNVPEVDSRSGTIDNNIIKNSVITNSSGVIRFGNNDGGDSNVPVRNNQFINCTFDNIDAFHYSDGSGIVKENNEFINNIFNDISSIGRSFGTGIDFDYNNFYNSWSNNIGTNSKYVDPQLDSNLVPTNIELKAGLPLTTVIYDKDKIKRNSTSPTIGAYEIKTPTVGSVTPSSTICEGETINLVASGGTTYNWNTGETTESIYVSPTDTTTYTVTVSDGTNSDTHEVIVTVIELPSVDAGNDLTICSEEEVTLTAEGQGNFLWSTGETTPTITVNPTQTTTYSVTASTSCDIDVTDEVIVTVNESPTITVDNSIFICVGESVDITASSNGNLNWSTGETSPTITVSPTQTTTYTVTSSIGDCSVSEEIEVNVDLTPSVDAGNDLTICYGEEIMLTAEGQGNFLWSTGETTPTITVNPTQTTTYSVTATTSCESDAIDELTVFVNEKPVLVLTADLTINKGDDVTLEAIGEGDFLWSTGEETPSISVSPTATTTYTVVLTSQNGCSIEESVVVTVIEDSSPIDESDIVIIADAGADVTICPNSSVVLTASGGGRYLWSTGEVTESITVNPTETTTYYVTVSDGVHIDITDVDDITVYVDENCSDTANRLIIQEFKVYPNPTSGILHIELSGYSNDLNLSLFNSTGKIIHSDIISNYSLDKSLKRNINLRKYGKGVYYARIVNNGKNETKKVIVM